MTHPGQIDHVLQGLARVPEKLRGRPGVQRVQRWLAVWLTPFNEIEQLLQDALAAFAEWQTTAATYAFVLDTIGVLLDQPRPEGFDDAGYIFLLQARTRVRRSSATREDILRVAEFLAGDASVRVFFLAPKQVIVQFEDVVLDTQQEGLYYALLLDTVGSTDNLEITYTTSASAGYDFGEYDEDLYV